MILKKLEVYNSKIILRIKKQNFEFVISTT